jgi:hypothetical protein
MVTREGFRPASAEQRLKALGIKLLAPPEPFGIYVEAVQTGNLLFLTGMRPPKAARRDLWDASARSSTSKPDKKRPASRHSMLSPSQGSIWDLSTG